MRTTIGSRAARLLAVVALVAVLALSACGARAHRSGGTIVGSNTGQPAIQQQAQPATSQNANLQSIQNTDQQVQNAVNSLDSASNDATQNFSAQDTQTVP
jgi:hypothetical protein